MKRHLTETTSELERACAVAMRGPEGAPELFRQLRESNVWFLMPYHPELGDKLEVRGGEGVPFLMWQLPEGIAVPVFTSSARAWQALETLGVGQKQCVVAELRGEYLWGVVSNDQVKEKPEVVINFACGTGSIFLTHDTVKGLADGSILKPVPPRRGVEATVKPVAPADYPADFLQPVLRFLSGRREVRAAWLLREVDPPNPSKVSHVFGLRLNCEGEEAARLEQDLTVVAKQVCPPDDEFGVMMLSAKDPAVVRMLSKWPAFYMAPDFSHTADPARNLN